MNAKRKMEGVFVTQTSLELTVLPVATTQLALSNASVVMDTACTLIKGPAYYKVTSNKGASKRTLKIQ